MSQVTSWSAQQLRDEAAVKKPRLRIKASRQLARSLPQPHDKIPDENGFRSGSILQALRAT